MSDRTTHAHTGTVRLTTGEPDAIGAAITIALCGAFDHDGPCPLAPHHTSWHHDPNQPAIIHTRTLYAVQPHQHDDALTRLREGLATGTLTAQTAQPPPGASSTTNPAPSNPTNSTTPPNSPPARPERSGMANVAWGDTCHARTRRGEPQRSTTRRAQQDPTPPPRTPTHGRDTPFTGLQDWYLRRTDGELAPTYDIQIDTLDEPGWRLEIRLDGTQLAGRDLPRSPSNAPPPTGSTPGPTTTPSTSTAAPSTSPKRSRPSPAGPTTPNPPGSPPKPQQRAPSTATTTRRNSRRSTRHPRRPHRGRPEPPRRAHHRHPPADTRCNNSAPATRPAPTSPAHARHQPPNAG